MSGRAGRAGRHRAATAEADRVMALLAAEYPAFYRLAALLSGSTPAAEVILGDALADVLRAGCRHRRERPLAAIRRRVVIRARHYRRRHGVQPKRDAGSLACDRSDVSIPRIRPAHSLIPAIDALPSRQREALILRYYAGLSVADIAVTARTATWLTGRRIDRGLAALSPQGRESRDLFRPPGT